jgi:hypothetical protein
MALDVTIEVDAGAVDVASPLEFSAAFPLAQVSHSKS